MIKRGSKKGEEFERNYLLVVSGFYKTLEGGNISIAEVRELNRYLREAFSLLSTISLGKRYLAEDAILGIAMEISILLTKFENLLMLTISQYAGVEVLVALARLFAILSDEEIIYNCIRDESETLAIITDNQFSKHQFETI